MEITNLQLFADNPNVNVTTDSTLSVENKACYLRAVGSATTSDACVTLSVLTLPAQQAS